MHFYHLIYFITYFCVKRDVTLRSETGGGFLLIIYYTILSRYLLVPVNNCYSNHCL